MMGFYLQKKPDNGDSYDWYEFEAWCMREGIGEDPEDWDTFWRCWKAAYEAAMIKASDEK